MSSFSAWFASILAFLAPVAQTESFVIRCSIFDVKRELIRSYPGYICAFAKDGSWVSYSDRRLTYYSPGNEVSWSQPGPYHHQVKFSEDERSVLTLGSQVIKGIRHDTVVKINLSGRIEKAFRFYDHQQDLLRWAGRPVGWKFPMKDPQLPGVNWEFSHANAIYELPPNPLEKTQAAFKAGNYIVTISNLGLIVILDRDLTGILWHFRHPESVKNIIHDSQLLPDGRLLVYNNTYGDVQQWQSVMEEFDPLTGKLLWRHKPADKFAAFAGGGIQKLANGGYLFSDTSSAGRVVQISPAGKQEWVWINPFEIPAQENPLYIQEAKNINLSGFLKRNSGF
jgi:hypothetical protein